MPRPRGRCHLLALPAPLDDVNTLCGLRLADNETSPRDTITGTPEAVTCIACLRTKVALLAYRVRELEGKPNDALP